MVCAMHPLMGQERERGDLPFLPSMTWSVSPLGSQLEQQGVLLSALIPSSQGMRRGTSMKLEERLTSTLTINAPQDLRHYSLSWVCGIRDPRILKSQHSCLCCDTRVLLAGCEVTGWNQVALKFVCKCRGLCTADHRPLRLVVHWQLARNNFGNIDITSGLT